MSLGGKRSCIGAKNYCDVLIGDVNEHGMAENKGDMEMKERPKLIIK